MPGNYFRLFGRVRLGMLKHAIGSIREHSRLKIVVVSASVIMLFGGMFWAAFEAFVFLEKMAGVGVIIIDRLFYLLYFSIFVMLVFSNIIVSYSTINRSKETAFLFSLPLPYETIYVLKFFETIFFSSWAFLFFLFPVMLAFGISRNVSGIFYLAVIGFFFPFAGLSASLGCLITILFTPWFNRPWFKKALLLVLVGGVLLAVLKMPPRQQLAADKDLYLAVSQLIPHFSISQHVLMPSYWMVEGVLQAGRGGLGPALFWWFLLLSNALLGMEICCFLSRGLYYPGWLAAQNPPRSRDFISGRGAIDRVFKNIFLPVKAKALLAKDLKVFWRDPVQWSQFLVFFGLLGVYFVNIRNLGYEELIPFWKNVIAFLNLASTIMTLSSLSVRFVFPQISLEGRNFWILGLAPLKYEYILWEKFFVNTFSMLLISLPLITVSNYMLLVPWQIMVTSVVLIFIMTITLAALAVGMGAIFPNYRQDNPAQIVSGFGGTLLLVVSLGYVVLSIICVALPFQRYYVRKEILPALFYQELAIIIAAIFLLSSAIIFFSMSAGSRALRNAEF